ncbi:hypothetical protein SynRS9907_00529 [Synechococcus sp. RS9907]|nr:hypothetical protein SynRS9907_00529 [Synechococcus sp. RS9907]
MQMWLPLLHGHARWPCELCRQGCLVVGEGIKKPPLNGGISQVIPITRPFNKCSASRQVCAADPPDVVD